MPCSTAKTSTQNTFQRRKQAAILEWRKMWCFCRWCSVEWLQDADVEHVVDGSPSRELELVRDCADVFQDLVRPGEAWTQFFEFWYYSTFVVIWQLISNHELIRLKRFILSFNVKLCN